MIVARLRNAHYQTFSVCSHGVAGAVSGAETAGGPYPGERWPWSPNVMFQSGSPASLLNLPACYLDGMSNKLISVRLDENVWMRARMWALQRRLPMGQMVETALLRLMDGESSGASVRLSDVVPASVPFRSSRADVAPSRPEEHRGELTTAPPEDTF